MFLLDPPTPPLENALVALAESPCGFCFADLGWTLEDRDFFQRLCIEKDSNYNAFGDLRQLEEGVAACLLRASEANRDLAKLAARKIACLARSILRISGEECAWFSLKATAPSTAFDRPRWHFDGHYFDGGEKQYKFAAALLGPSTLFYPMPTQFTHLRRVFWIHMWDRQFTTELCQGDPCQSEEGQGAFFLAGDPTYAAVHSEPPLRHPRLFLSLVPCSNKQIASLQKRVEKAIGESARNPGSDLQSGPEE